VLSMTCLRRVTSLMISRRVMCILTAIVMLTLVIQYGVTVSDSSPEIRQAFIRKVYTILCKLLIPSYRI
jgi:hypothetical protein